MRRCPGGARDRWDLDGRVRGGGCRPLKEAGNREQSPGEEQSGDAGRPCSGGVRLGL
jgi:hypothetical protein